MGDRKADRAEDVSGPGCGDGPRRRVNVLGVGVDALDLDSAVAVIQGHVRERRPTYVCITGMHGIMESQRDPSIRDIHNGAGMVTTDGMPLVWLCRLAGRRHARRVYGPDLMLAVLGHLGSAGLRHYFFGAAPGVPERLAARLAARFPGMVTVGTFSPPFGPPDSATEHAIVDRINAACPDILWVGLSTPKQERWMAAHRGCIKAPVMIGVGAAFDFHAGVKRQAPIWMQRSGLEWLFRLAAEPRRLWRRYLVNIPLFLALLTGQALGLRRYRIDDTSPPRGGT